ncbi:Putative quinone oxidoreductase YhdH [Fusobacterium necrogenes]|uniref:Quinone oxidoreductase YhdH n=1 Tax=Fusobacterium necrogenes TaxID=858 RepID=A0A377GVQ5_9FUSO|nr:YhdH/YhfP family quinone oxidoreductase [Fusobacterium necrogenes]STO31077.1 Putative quinone oxidoreductase YhdH [Fusobacterium necrogenes]
MKKFRALVVRDMDSEINYAIEDVDINMLSEGELIIRVEYSSVNYKDMLAVKKNGGVIRNYPMIPGIDLAGEVVNSKDERFKIGDHILVTGFQTGMTHTGGYSEYARIPADWVVLIPNGLTSKEVMIIGTAGFTAALSIIALEKGGMCEKNQPEILVTGASGGVGSIATQLLLKSGYKNISVLSKDKDVEGEFLKSLGVKNIYNLEDISPESEKGKPLGKQKFNYILDTVGGLVASRLLGNIYYGGSMSMCGNAAGIKFETTVLPFILRGINILGIDSVNFPREKRDEIWEKFINEWNIMKELPFQEVKLDNIAEVFKAIQDGKHSGRTVVKIG